MPLNGYKQSPEHKRKVQETRKLLDIGRGKNHHYFGQHRSLETREKIRKSLLGRPSPFKGIPTHRPSPWKGKRHSEESKQKNRIAYCESHWHPDAKNAHSTASGLFQFLASTWQKYGIGDVFDPRSNIDAAVALYQARGTDPWSASKGCWGSREP